MGALMRSQDTLVAGAAMAATACGASLSVVSLFNGWALAHRTALGYEIADVTWSPDAWAGFFWPALPVAPAIGLSLVIVGLLALRFGAAALVGVALGAGSAGLLLGLVAGPHWPSVLVTRLAWSAQPGPMVWAGLALAVSATIAFWVAWLASQRGARGRALTGAAAALTPMVSLAVTVAITAAVAAPAIGGVPVSRIPPVPDWRTTPSEPYPFVTPVPLQVATTTDGIYTREPTDHWVGTRAQCTRCAPFPRDYGRSTLTLELGRYRLQQVLPRYAASGHYTVAGDRITFFNDPECGSVYGVYRWLLRGDRLRLKVVDDPCAFGQRARDLTDTHWQVVPDA